MTCLHRLLGVAGLLVVAVSVGCGGSSVTQAEEKGDLQALIAGLQSEDWNTRADAAAALGTLGDSQAVPALIGVLGDETSSVLANAVGALAAIGDRRAVEPLAALLDRPASTFDDETVKGQIAQALGELGDSRAVPALVRSATDTYVAYDDYGSDEFGSDAYETAEAALLAIGKPAVEPLLEALELKNATRQQLAAEALGTIGDARAVRPLLGYGAEGSDEAAIASAALIEIGKPAVKPLIAGLERALASGDTFAAQAAVTALGQLGDRRAVPALQRAMSPDSPANASQDASEALAQMLRTDLPKLLAMLESPDTVGIYWGLIGLGKASTIDELIAALQTYGDESMAEDYLNCGNEKLENAARDWAESHGYAITTFSVPGFGEDSWGSEG